MRIDLYKVNKPSAFDLAVRFEEISRARLKSRNRHANGEFVRIEAVKQAGALWFADFVKVRTHHGPSKAGIDAPAAGFQLAADEGFGEETALLWDSRNNWCAVQYNHYGVRAQAMATYLALFDPQHPVPFEFVPKIDEDVHAKVERTNLVTKIDIAVAPKKLSDADFRAGAILGDAVKLLRGADADQIEIVISTRRRKRGLEFNARGIQRWVERLTETEAAVRAARITVKENVFAKAEVLDLLNQRVTTDEEIEPGVDKRYPQDERWKALERAHRGWKDLHE